MEVFVIFRSRIMSRSNISSGDLSWFFQLYKLNKLFVVQLDERIFFPINSHSESKFIAYLYFFEFCYSRKFERKLIYERMSAQPRVSEHRVVFNFPVFLVIALKSVARNSAE